MKHKIKELAEVLDNAARHAHTIEQLSNKQTITIADAYSIQNESITKRYTRGEKLVGLKMGFTSKAKMQQMGVNDLIWGRLTNAMEIKNYGTLDLNNFIHPRAEPEIAFLLKKDIKSLIPLEKVLDYVEGVAPAIEIIDSRYKNFKFSLEDVIADNCSSSAYCIGEWNQPNINIINLKLDLKVNNKIVESGNSSAILGNPLQSLVEAIRLAMQYGEKLKQGMIILAGAATPAIYINSKDKIEASFEKIGKVNLNVK